MSWEAGADGSGAWVPATHMGDPDGVLGSWILPDVALATVGRGSNQQIEPHFSLHHYFQ